MHKNIETTEGYSLPRDRKKFEKWQSFTSLCEVLNYIVYVDIKMNNMPIKGHTFLSIIS